MKRLLIAAALALSACSTVPVQGPGSVADQTVLDEKVASGVELAYRAARTAVEVAVDAGLIRGQAALKVAELDRTAFAAVKAVRSAYAVSNAQQYALAADQAGIAISALIASIKGGKSCSISVTC